MIKILFVCLGNICRSPLAEGVFNDFVIRSGLKSSILTDSCGTAGYHIGSLPDKRSIKTAANHGVVLEHKGRKLSTDDFHEFDFIFAMDENNYNDILTLQKRTDGNAKVLMFRDFDPKGKGDVPDPYYGGMEDFEEVYEICSRTLGNLLAFIQKEQN
jgi:protein-tyrosine phosphatase